MIIGSSNSDPKLVDDYDFVFLSGMPLPITIDKSIGDSIDFEPDKVIVHIAERVNPTDSTARLPKETLTIYLKNVALVQHRERSVYPQSPEQREEYKELLRKVNTPKTVH